MVVVVAPSDRVSKGRGRAPTSVSPVGVPGKEVSGQKHDSFSTVAAATQQSARAAKNDLLAVTMTGNVKVK